MQPLTNGAAVFANVFGRLVLLTLLLAVVSGPALAVDNVGIEAGKKFPITGMRALFITEDREKNTGLKEFNRSTCLAGYHGKHTTVAVLARTATPQVLELVQKIDELLLVHPSLHAWFLQLEGDHKDEVLQGQLRSVWTDRKLHGMELAISNISPERWEKYGVNKDVEATVVFSKKRQVLFSREIRFDELTEANIAETVAKIDKLAAE